MLVLGQIWVVCGLAKASDSGQLANTYLDRAQADLDRTRVLVAQGTLPASSLGQAQERVADAQDQVTLADTLYSPTAIQDMQPVRVEAMMAAAARRVARQQQLLDERQKLLEMGIISQAELGTVKAELASRRVVEDLARNRVKLVEELRQMAATEQRMELQRMELESPTLQNAMIRYNGAAAFDLSQLPLLEKSFKTQFHHDLPVSAVGQTMVHQSLGLDHRGKVDVALNPERPEGLWLRHYLEKLHISYLAFRSAVAGAATAPHIHIGAGSSRLSVQAR